MPGISVGALARIDDLGAVRDGLRFGRRGGIGAPGRGAGCRDGTDSIAVDAHGGAKRRSAAAVDDGRIAKHYAIHRHSLSWRSFPG